MIEGFLFSGKRRDLHFGDELSRQKPAFFSFDHTQRMVGMNIQEAIRSGKPFRREGWVDDDIYVVYDRNDIVLALETDPCTDILLEVQDILADDWYTRDDVWSCKHRPMETTRNSLAGASQERLVVP
jgi:hypothetical protein